MANHLKHRVVVLHNNLIDTDHSRSNNERQSATYSCSLLQSECSVSITYVCCIFLPLFLDINCPAIFFTKMHDSIWQCAHLLLALPPKGGLAQLHPIFVPRGTSRHVKRCPHFLQCMIFYCSNTVCMSGDHWSRAW